MTEVDDTMSFEECKLIVADWIHTNIRNCPPAPSCEDSWLDFVFFVERHIEAELEIDFWRIAAGQAIVPQAVNEYFE